MVAVDNGCTGREVDVQAEVWTRKTTDKTQTNSISNYVSDEVAGQ